MRKPKQLKQIQQRARRLVVHRMTPETYVVASSRSQTALQHVVTVVMGSDGQIHARCTCPWTEHGGFGCVHVMAVLDHLARSKQRRIRFWGTLEEARRQRHRVLRLAGGDEALYITSRPVNA